MAKILFEGAQATCLVVNISLLYMLLLFAKMPKKTETEKKHNALLLLFLSLVAFHLEGGSCPPHPPWLRL